MHVCTAGWYIIGQADTGYSGNQRSFLDRLLGEFALVRNICFCPLTFNSAALVSLLVSIKLTKRIMNV